MNSFYSPESQQMDDRNSPETAFVQKRELEAPFWGIGEGLSKYRFYAEASQLRWAPDYVPEFVVVEDGERSLCFKRIADFPEGHLFKQLLKDVTLLVVND